MPRALARTVQAYALRRQGRVGRVGSGPRPMSHEPWSRNGPPMDTVHHARRGRQFVKSVMKQFTRPWRQGDLLGLPRAGGPQAQPPHAAVEGPLTAGRQPLPGVRSINDGPGRPPNSQRAVVSAVRQRVDTCNQEGRPRPRPVCRLRQLAPTQPLLLVVNIEVFVSKVQ